jgi:hypothetical protein
LLGSVPNNHPYTDWNWNLSFLIELGLKLALSYTLFVAHFGVNKGAFTPNVKSVLSKNLGGMLGGSQY